MELFLKDRDYYEKLFLCNQTKRARSCVVVCACVVIHQLSANAHQLGAEDAINWAQDFCRGRDLARRLSANILGSYIPLNSDTSYFALDHRGALRTR